ncbi:transmembrane emp24 domain-containing protein 1-like isoform X2 [Seriola dumerili]|uniref:transmembrane emp24 domain-containing protein 1-like isoform X2 n=1 Tax=Seriola dumerili TaxID=41447 RepID=UPI000BBE1F31|nr:transmembrane emp24 domain-containing protein 1-like isoform X2 [Seriola dumerili]
MRRRWLNLDSVVFGNMFTMDLIRRKEGSGGRLFVLAVIFGWCLGSVRCFGQSQDSEFTFLLPAGRSECFFQTAVKNGTMEVEYQVIAGAGMDVDVTILSPEGVRLIMESRRSDGVHVVEPTEEGDYQICFDNSFSRFSEKMESMDSLHRRLERSRQMQTVLRAFEARDRNLLEDNLWRVSFWSCASVLVMLCVALTQVYTVRKLFDDKRRVYT